MFRCQRNLRLRRAEGASGGRPTPLAEEPMLSAPSGACAPQRQELKTRRSSAASEWGSGGEKGEGPPRRPLLIGLGLVIVVVRLQART